MWKILLEEFIGDLKIQKLRAFLTMFAITWGTIAVVLLLAFGEGLKVAIINGLMNAGDRIFMVYGGETSKIFEGLPTGRRIRLTEDDLDLLRRSIQEIEFGSPSYGRWGTSLKWGDSRTTTYMEGVYPEFSELRRMFPAAGGRFINQEDLDRRRRVLFLGNDIAERIFGQTDPIGQTVMLDGLPFTVIGVMQKKFQDSSNNGPDEDRAIIPASTLKTIYGRRYVNHLIVRPREVRRAPFVRQELFRVLGRRYQFDPTDERALFMWDFIEDTKMVTAIGLGIQIFLGLVGSFTLLVAGVGVANIMYVVVRERTKEIGVKLAVGARRVHIMAQFIFEALLIALTGGGAGLAFSGLVVVLVNAIPTDNPAMTYLANPILSWPIALTCVSILVLIGLAAGILPARRAAAVDPVESLRYE
ncbi:MAG: FtsX-like permease family protein [Gemmatimonadales bacterium]|nr:FtsX-like permease family protein [Gemmatimonadales bacterium]NIN12032.1 FtsX-like permease family protein [Gemmatimonadales bacterium]NIR03267.1 FtsX-like permease family protein [Gemmatimonadales bacterium]NIS66947.1 FtsX-like permease family protein [Gemmatimonadales bacterium]